MDIWSPGYSWVYSGVGHGWIRHALLYFIKTMAVSTSVQPNTYLQLQLKLIMKRIRWTHKIRKGVWVSREFSGQNLKYVLNTLLKPKPDLETTQTVKMTHKIWIIHPHNRLMSIHRRVVIRVEESSHGLGPGPRSDQPHAAPGPGVYIASVQLECPQ